jgi:hypothetical protein
MFKNKVKTKDEFMYSGRKNNSCSTSGIRRDGESGILKE